MTGRIASDLVKLLAKRLRCPVVAADLRFELVVRLASDGSMTISMPTISEEGERAAILGRLAGARVAPASRLRASTLVGLPIRLLWADQRLQRAPD